MRICLVSQEYPPDTAHGGIATQTYAKAHGLARRGHQVHVVSHSLDEARHHSREGDVDIVRIASADSHLPICTEPVRWISYSGNVAAELAALQAKLRFDLIDFPEWGCEGYIHLLNRVAGPHARTVVQLHGPLVMFAKQIGWPEPNSLFYQICSAMERTCLRLADAIFSSSDCSADWVAREYGLDRAAIPTIHTGVDLSLFRPLDLPRDERPTIIFVGKIARSKGVELLVEAALRIADEWPDLRLRLVGKGDEVLAAQLVERTCAAGRPGLLELAGLVERKHLPAELSKADLFVAPSFYEGGPGFVYLEAMACGLAVIACSGSGASEVVRHEENGLLVPPGDVETLTEALRQMLADRPRRQSLARAGLEFVRRKADGELCLNRLESFYHSVVGR